MAEVERALAVLYAVDPVRVAAFYEAVAGMHLEHAEGGPPTLRSPVLELVVLGAPSGIFETIALTDPPQRREDTPIKLGFAVESIEAARAVAPAYGGVVDGADREWEWEGLRRCDGHDPEGNVVQLLERIS